MSRKPQVNQADSLNTRKEQLDNIDCEGPRFTQDGDIPTSHVSIIATIWIEGRLTLTTVIYIYIYIYAFSRHFYPKRLPVHSGYNFF